VRGSRVIAALQRAWQRFSRLFLNSLSLRTVALSVGLTGVAIILVGGYLSLSIGSDLFTTRKDQVLADSARATVAAQAALDSADVQDEQDLNPLILALRTAVNSASISRMASVQRLPGQPPALQAPPDFYDEALAGGVVSDNLVRLVAQGEDPQYWQSVTLIGADGQPHPGIIVGTRLEFPLAGSYGLFLGYDLSETEQTLGSVQRTLALGGASLVFLVALVAWIVVRFVVRPLTIAADTSKRIAAGEGDVRMPKQRDEVFDTLAGSFNEMADSLQNRIRELAELSLVQQRFVSDVSHELRTPLTTIRLAGDVLYRSREGFDPTSARTAELLHTQIGRFEELLTDLLEISRYDAGSVTLEREPTNLVRLAEEEVQSMRALAERSGSEIFVHAEGGYFAADVDPRRVRRILGNLLGNAIEHGEGKPIVVTVDSNELAVAISVRDYGMGMNESDTARVFDRFWRADPSRRRTIGGTGLGLAISLEDALAHEGALEVWSEPGRGSCFRLTLPRNAGEPYESSPLPLPPLDAGASEPEGVAR